MPTESQAFVTTTLSECPDNWHLLPGNIPSLYELCRDTIRSHDALKDALILNHDVYLPDHVVEDVLDDRDPFDGRPVACREDSEFISCGCMSFFNPGSAVFVDEETAVLLEGRCCLKKSTVKIGSDGNDIRWRAMESVPNALVRNGTCCRRFVLRVDGAMVGITQDTLCVLPPDGNGDSVQVKLHFNTPARYCDIILPSLIRSYDLIFALGKYRTRGGSVRCFDVLKINTRTGEVSSVSLIGTEDERSDEMSGIQHQIPDYFDPSNLAQLPNDRLVLVGCIPEVVFNMRGGAHPVVCTCSVCPHEYHPSKWVMSWKCVKAFEKEADRISHLHMASSGVAYSEFSNMCVIMFNKGGMDMDFGQMLSTSIDGGETWGDVEMCRQRLTTMGVTNDPPLIAFAPSGKLFAFAYEERDCQLAEQKSLLRQSKRKTTVKWPSMNIYRWSGA